MEQKYTSTQMKPDSEFDKYHLLSSYLKEQAILSKDNDIDLKEVWSLLWERKILIFSVMGFFFLASLVFAVNLPNEYRATAMYIATDDKNVGSNPIGGQFGGLASLAGISINNSGSQKLSHAIELMQTWAFVEHFVSKHNLKAIISASSYWDKTSNHLSFDNEVYDDKNQKWLTKDGKTLEPTSYKTFLKFKDKFNISQDASNGIITISFTHYSPEVSVMMIELLVEEINSFFKEKDTEFARQSIDFLNIELSKTTNTEMRKIFYSMIETHSKTLMFAEISNQYLIKTLSPALVPERKEKPNRVLLVILGTFLGVVVGCLLSFLQFKFRSKN